MPTTFETVVILDFGSQYTQLIARRVRETGVYCEIHPFNTSIQNLQNIHPKGIILSGGPSSVYEEGAPHCSAEILKLGIPVLGICYGVQLLSYFLGGKVESSARREYGAARLSLTGESRLLTGLPSDFQVWMSHGDHVTAPPPGFQVVAKTENALGALEDPANGLYGLQFHPEVAHTPNGKQILENFVRRICGCHADWSPASFVQMAVERVKEQVGEGKAVCGLSGGVDSAVAAALVARAMGDRLTCVFVDNGLLRKNEFEKVLQAFRDYGQLNVKGVAAGERFLQALKDQADPERKRKIIGNEFIEVFQEEANQLGEVDFLVQGTLYPDVIESVSVKGPSAVIKSHHNVGGLPEKMKLKLVEPLRELFKDEVRAVGRELGLPEMLINRQPFPGPGLAVRILGSVDANKVALLQEADNVVLEEIKRAGLYEKIWQAFAVLLPIQTVGVMGDFRTYENAVAIRAVESSDGMTADWARLPYDVLENISRRIVSEVRGINRVVYDISSKPPSTIEWE
ncbi:MAG TPA: glutamine-hydrolyzing GMP synthase [Blastocatellia bacterium]|nr:glutamine-hydrolyzing GMP synthase [Blastocatellia bacterium]HMX27724.1 glutamine-hydrolyzing GMP synthase [Blastocatellia bacterium]HMZ19000.1 glutamine-hydrolyzing GMP synthase [Blastocatellia bacterium]HNG28312.1 glutamine-hydrolyzing GMP synthase [Blastocatellia bacterium]